MCINALMEFVIGLYKTECIRATIFHSGPYRTIGEVEYATSGWVDWYNNRRLHRTLGMMTPEEFEQAQYATLNREPQPVWSGGEPVAALPTKEPRRRPRSDPNQ